MSETGCCAWGPAHRQSGRCSLIHAGKPQRLHHLRAVNFDVNNPGYMPFLGKRSRHRSAGLASPFFFKGAVDKLVEEGVAGVSSSLRPCIYGLLLYGGMRMVSQVTREAQLPLFTPVSQVRPRPLLSTSSSPALTASCLPSCCTVCMSNGLPARVRHSHSLLIAARSDAAHRPCNTRSSTCSATGNLDQAVQHIAQCSLDCPQTVTLLQAVSRRVAHHTFGHVLGLDIRYHLDRRTGELSRVLERGTRSTQTLFRGIVFTLLPTALELLLVCATLGRLFNGAVAAAVATTFAVYVAWTAHYIRISSQVRKDLNDLDTRTSGKAVDALLNFETVRSTLCLVRRCRSRRAALRPAACRRGQPLTHRALPARQRGGAGADGGCAAARRLWADLPDVQCVRTCRTTHAQGRTRFLPPAVDARPLPRPSGACVRLGVGAPDSSLQTHAMAPHPCITTGDVVQVVLFNNQEAEMSQYHMYLSQYQSAMGRIEQLAALLNAGQAIILNAGIMAALIAAVTLSPTAVTAGDIVLIHGFLLQLWSPLQFLGWFFRCGLPL